MIDIVILWVDQNDQKWSEQYAFYRKEEKNVYSTSSSRYRDWELLKYWFRSIEQNASWVNKIHFVTYGHLPYWLNLNNKKLNIVLHSEIIDSEFLPTFNSHTIELNIHRIKGLAEKFIYFNDDFFLNQKIKPEFFFKKNLPVDFLVMDSLRQTGVDSFFGCIKHRSIAICNSYFKKYDVLTNLFFKVFNFKYGIGLLLNILNLPMSNFSYLSTPHLPQAYLKKVFSDVWENEEQFLNEVCRNKFRQATDVNQYIFRNWQLLSGLFNPVYPYNRGNFYNINSSNIDSIVADIVECRTKTLCINDSDLVDNFDELKEKLTAAFNLRYPNKSSFEL